MKGNIVKTEWEFMFNTYEFVFTKEHKYSGHATIHDLNLSFDYKFRIVPNTKKFKAEGSTQAGSLFIIMPFDLKEAEKYIYTILIQLVEKIQFEYGKFEVSGGMIMGTYLPECEEEEKRIAEGKHFVKMKLEVLGNEPQFDSGKIINNLDFDMITQFNNANQAKHSIDKLNGFFKILENYYSLKSKTRQELKQILKNDELEKVYSKINLKYKKEEFYRFIDKIVDARHRCSHLKKKQNFGYLPYDQEVKDIVEPLIMNLKPFVKELIRSRSNTI